MRTLVNSAGAGSMVKKGESGVYRVIQGSRTATDDYFRSYKPAKSAHDVWASEQARGNDEKKQK